MYFDLFNDVARIIDGIKQHINKYFGEKDKMKREIVELREEIELIMFIMKQYEREYQEHIRKIAKTN